ncbi:MAG: hypothetical protein HZB37_05010 [Planctomycetes bacterium]|nr:hypothetical protein [Planctomycetota bacterium]MBI5962735.1 hypothetical protein [Chloroflexota bacterium]
MNNQNELRVVETPFFVIDVIKRSWRERLFSWPWRPWVGSASVNTPSMVRIGTDIYCHPSLTTLARRMAEHSKKADDDCCNCEWTWDSATSNGQCEFCERRQWFEEVDQA